MASAPRAPASSSPPAQPSQSWIVQKYGGTSVGKFLSTIVHEIVPSYRAAHRVAVVCSARSGKTKALGTTNLLLQAAAQALEFEDHDPPSLSASLASLPPLGSSTPSTPLTSDPAATSASASSPVRAAGGHAPEREPSSSPASRSPSRPQPPLYQATVEQILSDHLEAARANVQNRERLVQLEQDLSADCAHLREFLLAARVRLSPFFERPLTFSPLTPVS